MNFISKAKSLQGKRGFTLIELLVVIAIIGILAALVLVALGNARDKANDAKIKSDMGQLRTLAEVIYDTKGATYATVASCFEGADPSTDATNCGDTGTGTSVETLKTDITNANTANDFQANASASAFCVSARMKNNNYVCVDASGQFKETTTSTCGAAATVCP